MHSLIFQFVFCFSPIKKKFTLCYFIVPYSDWNVMLSSFIFMFPNCPILLTVMTQACHQPQTSLPCSSPLVSFMGPPQRLHEPSHPDSPTRSSSLTPSAGGLLSDSTLILQLSLLDYCFLSFSYHINSYSYNKLLIL